LRIIEVGCGSGVYLRYAAHLNPQATGLGIDMQEGVVRHAAENLRKWGIGERFRVLHADIRNPPPELDGPFDLATLYNNTYYFAPEERPDLFRSLRSRLAPGGALGIVSAMRGKGSAFTIDLDLVLRSTVGNTALPDLDELTTQLKESGFESVDRIRLVPVEPLYGLVAR
jgi:cyclopropane fatty-acyl-phospholipid synthase-like methyltransferase